MSAATDKVKEIIMYRFALGLAIVMSAASAQGQSPSASSQPPLTTRATPRLLPGTRVDVFSTIRGSAFDSEDAKLPSSLVRLRDTRMGQVIDTQVTDKSGVFAFYRVDPGYYIVELFDSNRRTLAASPMVITGPGATASTTVKLPIKSSMLASLLTVGGSGTSSGAATSSGPASAAT